MESDIRYYRRRANEEMAAANRAVTDAARARRLQLADLYAQRLAALEAARPFDERDVALSLSRSGPGDHRSAFGWSGDQL